MNNHITIYKWNSIFQEYILRILIHLEKMNGEKWIERKRRFLISEPYYGIPTEAILKRRGNIIKMIASDDINYPNPSLFSLNSNYESIQSIYYKYALDYGRCVLYLCDSGEVISRGKYVQTLMFDRQTRNWFYINTIPTSNGLLSFMDWLDNNL